MRPQILKQHVAGIEVSGLFDLKRIMLSLPLTSIDICELTRPGNTYVQALSGIESP